MALCSLHQNPSGFGAKGAFTGAPYGSTGECDRRTGVEGLWPSTPVLHAPKSLRLFGAKEPCSWETHVSHEQGDVAWAQGLWPCAHAPCAKSLRLLALRSTGAKPTALHLCDVRTCTGPLALCMCSLSSVVRTGPLALCSLLRAQVCCFAAHLCEVALRKGPFKALCAMLLSTKRCEAPFGAGGKAPSGLCRRSHSAVLP